MPNVAIVILNWNGLHYLQQFLPSVLSSTYNSYEVVVADNASTDASLSFLREHYPQVRIVSLKENFGFAKGYNEALKEVKATYYVLLNSDVEVHADWLQPMVALLESDKNIAACQPKIRSYYNRNSFEYAGAAGGWIDKFGYPFAKGRIFDVLEEDRGQYDQQETIFWASGAALFIRSDMFHVMNGFDEYFFAHQEEIDLCWRLQLSGKKIFSCPQALVYHVGGGTLAQGNPQKTYLNFRNNLIMLYKNLSFGQKCWKLPLRIMLDAVTAWKELVGGDGGYFFAIVRAHARFIKWIFGAKDKRFVSKSKEGILYGNYKGSIVWQFFIRKKRLFSQIIR